MEIIVIPLIGSLIIALIVVAAIVRTHRRRVLTAGEGLIGKIGLVTTAIEPDLPGQVLLQGEYWRAFADQTILLKEEVKVVSCRNLTVFVQKV